MTIDRLNEPGKIKAVVFDMDGVLIDAKDWHYDCLNLALGVFGTTISREEHLSTFDGLPTRRKLEMLSDRGTIPKGLRGFINDLKQRYTQEAIHVRCKPTFIHEYALSRLKARGFRLALASNSVRKTVELMMERAQLTKYLEFMLSNEDVKNPKPAPDIYQMAITRLGLQPDEVVIVEDNEHGLQSAQASGGHVLKVDTVDDVNLANITRFIEAIEKDAC